MRRLNALLSRAFGWRPVWWAIAAALVSPAATKRARMPGVTSSPRASSTIGTTANSPKKATAGTAYHAGGGGGVGALD